eukprot:CAMPEP_0172471770 /NCGR_PEP_ID=MMETSP1065-20121228/67991_1 /TAXON_ID=265537 /ORGANISM="Amphiprora paludosa, Strain CCMP125" /LENGTH=786 /DNA_ID=CAMNT_0013229883 /DNA_START=52 /DNA_END=2414 /DNA_ORIENTATION=-
MHGRESFLLLLWSSLCFKGNSFTFHGTAKSLSTTTKLRSSVASAIQTGPAAIQVENLSCSHNGGETWQLKDVSYVLPQGARVALVGRNGAGKSTFLRILATSVSLDQKSEADNFKYDGQITAPRKLSIAYVEQEPAYEADLTVEDALLGLTQSASSDVNDRPTNVYVAVRQYRQAMQNAEESPEKFADAAAAMDQFNGWDVLTRAEEVATKLRVWHLQEQSLAKLSGGERKRVALAAALVQEPDVLLLDEPTNFLSLAGVQWLSDVLLQGTKKITILMVTHDRAFLDQVCDRIVELDNGNLYEYIGNYGSYLEAKDERLQREQAALKAAKNKYRVELDWMRRQPQARETKQKARIDAFYKLEAATKPKPNDDPNLSLSAETRRLGGKILSLRNVNLSFGDRLMLKDFSYDFLAGDRICLAGANGVGKTTFVKVLTGELPCDSGTIEQGDTIVMGVYDQKDCLAGANGVGKTTFVKVLTGELPCDSGTIEQVRMRGVVLAGDRTHHIQLGFSFSQGDTIVMGVYDQKGITIDDPEQTVLQFVLESVQSREDGLAMAAQAPDEARKLLRRFEFPKQRWNERVSVLSGGERRRLQMLQVLTIRPNFLVMDEPSTDCDLDTLTALEQFLQEFKGVLIVVSHDRSFADKVADHLFIFEGNGEVKDFVGTLSEYASTLIEIEGEGIGVGGGSNEAPGEKKSTYKEDRAKRNQERNAIRQAKKEIDKLEKSMEKIKAKVVDIQGEIDSRGDEGWTVLAELTEQLGKYNEEVEEKELRWLELAELLEESEAEIV